MSQGRCRGVAAGSTHSSSLPVGKFLECSVTNRSLAGPQMGPIPTGDEHARAAKRQAVHRVLAEVTDRQLDTDRRAWHRGHAAAEPDEDVAADLERSAERAERRGGAAAGAAFLERAATLTADPGRRGPRTLAAAHAKFEAATYDVADALS